MTIDQFWNIVDRVHAAAPDDMDAKCGLLKDELRKLPPGEIESFGQHFTDCFYRAYTKEIWDAASLIHGGCGDDSFMDFRAVLISLGRAPYEAAIASADSLADFSIDPAWATYQGYQYVVGEICEEMGFQRGRHGTSHPGKAAGVACPQWEMSSKFPKLAAKYGHNDADFLDLKVREEKRVRDANQAGQLADLMLAAGIIPACGLIPPLRVVAVVLRTGRSPDSAGRAHTWESFNLDEGIFWQTVARLEKLESAALTSRPDLKSVALRLDVSAGTVQNYDEWTQSLKQRGLM